MKGFFLYGMTTFEDYLIPKVIHVEQQQYYLTHSCGIREFIPFPKSKRNGRFKLVTVGHVSHYDTGIALSCENGRDKGKKEDTFFKKRQN